MKMSKSKKEMTETQKEFIDKWLIILLASDNFNPIRGRIRLVKEFFLIWREKFYDLGNIAEFYSYFFGPYSTLFAVRVNDLFYGNTIEFEESGLDILYKLSEKGKKQASQLISEEPQERIEYVVNNKRRFSKISTGKILGEIYRKYPSFADLSLASEETEIGGKIPIEISKSELITDGLGFIKSTDSSEDFIVSKKYKDQFLQKIKDESKSI